MEPSVGILDPTWVKALVIDDGTTKVCFVTLDGIGADGNLADLAFDIVLPLSHPFTHY
jgi:hypothetical protein